MRLPALLHPLLVPLCCGILSVASPGITSNTAGPGVTSEATLPGDDGSSNYTTANHSIVIAGLSASDIEKNIFIEDIVRLKLECNLTVESMDEQINVSWRHGKEQISSNQYTYNTTDNQWSTRYEFIVTDMNKTGDYMCIFTSGSGGKIQATFSLQVPQVHGGSKAVVTYNGDLIVLKCDTSKYEPQKWYWYKVTDNDLIPINASSDPQKYDECNKKRNETKLRITDLSEADSGTYVCKADFRVAESKGEVEIKVLSYMVPLKVFFVIAAEVVVLVTVIAVYEILTKKKRETEEVKQEYEQMSQLKSEDSINAEASTTRQRKS